MVSVQDAQNAQERIVNVMRDNPIPLALMGIGLGVLVAMGARSMRGEERGFTAQEPSGYAGPSRRYGGYGATSEYSTDELGQGQPLGGGRYRGDGEARGRMARERLQRMQERAGGMTRQLRHRAGRAAETARHYADTAQHRMRGMRYQMNDYAARSARVFEERPLMTGAMAFALGAMIGAMLPRTRGEEEFYGEARERMGDIGERAGEVGREAYERVREAAAETARMVREESREAGERLSEELQRQAEEGSPGTAH